LNLGIPAVYIYYVTTAVSTALVQIAGKRSIWPHHVQAYPISPVEETRFIIIPLPKKEVKFASAQRA